MNRLVISDEARLDSLEAAMWYEAQRTGLGNEFQKSFEKVISAIQRNPLHFQVRYRCFRICFLSRFPYGVHYWVDGDIIRVFGVFHTSKDPGNWFDRLSLSEL